MKAKFQFVNPDDMTCSLTITMRLSDWKDLRKQLTDSYPSWKVSGFIGDIITAASKVFTDEEQEVEK